jgi:hypothetical protein
MRKSRLAAHLSLAGIVTGILKAQEGLKSDDLTAAKKAATEAQAALK